VIVVLAACSHPAAAPDAPPQDAACSVPVPRSECAPHGLATVDLAGTWTLVGTATDDHCMTNPTMAAVNRQVSFAVGDCAFGPAGGTLDGKRSDTLAEYGGQGPSSSTFAVSVCADVTGMIRYFETDTQRCIPTMPTPDTVTITGTLTR
jgi:hypothetical protein